MDRNGLTGVPLMMRSEIGFTVGIQPQMMTSETSRLLGEKISVLSRGNLAREGPETYDDQANILYVAPATL